MWESLRGRKLDDHKFRRQYPVGGYILDFVCVECRLVVELDGAHHTEDDCRRYDQARSEHLEQFGYRVVRFSNAMVLSDLDTVLDDIRRELMRESPHRR